MTVTRNGVPAWIEQKERELTRAALDDVDAGRVIDQRAVQAWVQILSAS